MTTEQSSTRFYVARNKITGKYAHRDFDTGALLSTNDIDRAKHFEYAPLFYYFLGDESGNYETVPVTVMYEVHQSERTAIPRGVVPDDAFKKF
jgi:hypothetical protein